MRIVPKVWKATIFWGFSFVLLLAFSVHGANPGFEIQPYVQAVSKASATVFWKSGVGSGRVEYGPTKDYGASAESRTVSKAKKGTGEQEAGGIDHVRLVDLQPDTVYHYRVVLSSFGSADRTFRTAPAATDGCFTFLVYGDSRSNPETHARVISAAANACQPAFVLSTGDTVPSDKAKQSVWMKEFFRPAEPLLQKTWFLLTRGNHESLNGLFSSYFEAAGGSQKEDYYGFDWGPVHVVTLNTNKDYSPGSAQYEFLKHDLGENSRPFKIFFGHHPPYSSGLHGSVKKMQECLEPLFEENGVQLVFSGHDHSYERTIVKGITYIVSGGGGAPLYAQQNNSKNPKSLVYREAFHFVRVDVTPEELVLTTWALGESGQPTQADHAVIKR